MYISLEIQTRSRTVVLFVVFLERSGINGDDGVLDKGLGTDQLVGGGVVHDIDDTGLTGARLGTPGEVSGLQTKSAELLVTTHGTDGSHPAKVNGWRRNKGVSTRHVTGDGVCVSRKGVAVLMLVSELQEDALHQEDTYTHTHIKRKGGEGHGTEHAERWREREKDREAQTREGGMHTDTLELRNCECKSVYIPRHSFINILWDPTDSLRAATRRIAPTIILSLRSSNFIAPAVSSHCRTIITLLHI